MSDEEKLKLLCDRDWAGEATSYAVQKIYDITVKNRCKTILELGVRSGVSTRTFLLACKVTGGHLWSIDLSNINVKNIHYGDNWWLKGYWTYFEYTDDLNCEWNIPLDLLFIDTTHTYKQTLAELNKFSPYVKHGGKILMHDSLLDHIDGWGVLEAIEKFIKCDPYWYFYETGVKGGLAVLTKLYPFKWLFI